mgnify:CR=1 FL=1
MNKIFFALVLGFVFFFPSIQQGKLTDFQNLQELQQFLAEDDTDNHIYLRANSQGIVEFDKQCTTVAEQLRDRAMAKGKYLSYQILNYDKPESHAVNMAWIGKGIYFIDTQTDRVWLNSYRGNK